MYVISDTLPLVSKFDIDDQEHRRQYNPEGSHNYQHNKYCKVHPCVLNSETLIMVFLGGAMNPILGRAG